MTSTPIAITRATFLANAQRALGMPTLYWLDYGGWKAGQPPSAQPGQIIDPVLALKQKKLSDPVVAAKYEAGLAQAGLSIASLPRLACDCSRFVAWALEIPYSPSPFSDGKFTTPTIVADALKPRPLLFRKLDRPVAGAMLVFPPRGAEHGHIGILTPDEQGRPTRVIHCAPDNYLLEPPAPRARSAIAETGTAYFDQHGAIVVDCIAFRGESAQPV